MSCNDCGESDFTLVAGLCGECIERNNHSALSAAFAPCGLNADWCVSAWHVGLSTVPNMTDGDVYILSDENEAGTFSVVQQFPSRIETGDNIVEIASDLSLSDAFDWAKTTLRNIRKGVAL